MKRFWLIPLCVLSVAVGCAYVNMPTALALKNIDRADFDFAHAGIRMTAPKNIRVFDDRIAVIVAVSHEGLAKPEKRRFPIQVIQANNTWTFKADPKSIPEITRLQALSREWIAQGKEGINDRYWLQYDGCRTGHVDMRQRITVFVKWQKDGDYKPILTHVPLHLLAKGIGAKDIPLCKP